MTPSAAISERIMQAMLSRKLAPGSRLGEHQLAEVFDCSRTIVREALTILATRGLVTVSARRGWYVVEHTQEQAREIFEARRLIETGLIRATVRVTRPAIRRLRAHLARQQAAAAGSDIALRSFLLGDFHVCLAECLGNGLLAETLRDFTARTTLVAMRYQSDADADQSWTEHVQLVDALEAGDLADAERLMAAHLSTWHHKLPVPAAVDPLAPLRAALSAVEVKVEQPRRRRHPPLAAATDSKH